MTGSFPGAVFFGNGEPTDRRRTPLTVTRLYSYPHRLFVSLLANRTAIMVWALGREAVAESIPIANREVAVGYMIGGGGILLLGHTGSTLVAVRDMLLDSLGDTAELARALEEDEAQRANTGSASA